MPDRKKILFISDIADSAEAILEYTRGLAYKDFIRIEKPLPRLSGNLELLAKQ